MEKILENGDKNKRSKEGRRIEEMREIRRELTSRVVTGVRCSQCGAVAWGKLQGKGGGLLADDWN